MYLHALQFKIEIVKYIPKSVFNYTKKFQCYVLVKCFFVIIKINKLQEQNII